MDSFATYMKLPSPDSVIVKNLFRYLFLFAMDEDLEIWL